MANSNVQNLGSINIRSACTDASQGVFTTNIEANAPFIRSVEQKATMVHLLRQSIQEQQRLYGSPSGMATPISTHSFVTSRSLPSLTVPQSNLPHQSSSPSLLHQLHRVTSPTPSSFSTATGR